MELWIGYILLFATAFAVDLLAYYMPAIICSTVISVVCRDCSKLTSFDNIPASFGIRFCPDCGSKINSSMPIATIAAIFLFIFLLFTGDSLLVELSKPSRFMLVLLLLIVTAFDVKFQLIPNKVLIIAALIAFGGMASGLLTIRENLLASFTVALVMLLIRLGSMKFMGKAGVGMGDVKLIAVLALFVGWDIIWISYAGFLMGGLVAAIGLLSQLLDRDSRLPMAPFLLAGALLFFVIDPSAKLFS